MVLWYRLATDGSRHPGMIRDAQRGMRLTRQWVASLKRNNQRVAAMGSSAGGRLVATLAAYHDQWIDEHDDLRTAYNARPDAILLSYPIIDLQGAGAYTGSRRNLLEESPQPALLRALSLQNSVKPGHMPVFAWSTADDASVQVGHSILYAQACWAVSLPCELHVFKKGRHGLGLAEEYADVSTWFDHAVAFLQRHLAMD
jgi:acetyl esterase/lipase